MPKRHVTTPLPDPLYEAAVKRAKQNGISLTELVCRGVAAYCNMNDAQDRGDVLVLKNLTTGEEKQIVAR